AYFGDGPPFTVGVGGLDLDATERCTDARGLLERPGPASLQLPHPRAGRASEVGEPLGEEITREEGLGGGQHQAELAVRRHVELEVDGLARGEVGRISR